MQRSVGVANLATRQSRFPPHWVGAARSRPGRKLLVYERVVTGRVREPTYRYKLRAALSGGIAAPGRQVGDPYELKGVCIIPFNEPIGCVGFENNLKITIDNHVTM